MKTYYLVFIVLAFAACGPSPSDDGNVPASRPASEGGAPQETASKKLLAPHVIASNTSLAPKNGRRIEIRVSDAKLTKEQCTDLINAYKAQAGPEGQVSVRKPSKDGNLYPWCVDNCDGTPIMFNDMYFQ